MILITEGRSLKIRWKNTKETAPAGDGAKIPPAVATAAPSPDDDEPKGEFDWYAHAAELKKLNDRS